MDGYTYGKEYYRLVGEPLVDHYDVELTDPVDEVDEIVYQLYVRGINVGNATHEIKKDIWHTAFSPEGVTGGQMEDINGIHAEDLMYKVAREFYLVP